MELQKYLLTLNMEDEAVFSNKCFGNIPVFALGHDITIAGRQSFDHQLISHSPWKEMFPITTEPSDIQTGNVHETVSLSLY